MAFPEQANIQTRAARQRGVRRDALLIAAARGSAGLAGMAMLLIIMFLVWEAVPVVRTAGLRRLFTDAGWYPSEGQYNLMPMVLGTMMLVGCAVPLASLLGTMLAIFCHFYAPPPIARGYRRLLAVLTGMPSVVYGLWGLVVLVPRINRFHPPGTSLLAGLLVLQLMLLPTIALMADSQFSQAAPLYLRGAAALGLGRWGTIRGVMLPAIKNGLLTGVLLQTGRALGETMAVLMVCGNVVQVPRSFFDPIRTLSANIALEMAYALGTHRAALFVSGLVLTVCSVVCIGVTRWLGGRHTHG